jgi:glycosyltransferase involved in cell wall biosynthesis
MVRPSAYPGDLSKVVFIGNYVPRQCGIATFTTDLLTAVSNEMPSLECWAVAMNDVPGGYAYPQEVRFEINQRVLTEYRLAADFLNVNRVDVVCLQHEYGIFGGEYGAYILELLSGLRMPIVSTLHTVLMQPTPGQFSVLRRICQLSDRVVVLSWKAVEILKEVYHVPQEKIVMIPHGIPDVPFVDPNFYKDQFGVEGKKVILTFGLISPGKGIEYMIDALPGVVEKHPDVVYLVLGATHPHIRREQGESYRLSLQRRARELGVDDHIIFHNRFVSLEELCEFLGAADVYVTPYLNKEQIVSGTLAYAMGAGKATVSTPYWYAEEMLANGRGCLVPFRDSSALAEQIIYLLDNEVERHAMRKRAYTFCRDMVWKEVARKYLETFATVKAERERRPRAFFFTKEIAFLPEEIPQPRLDHLIRLTDNVGVIQHAKYIVPNRHHGYCTDDNARALITVLLANDVNIELEQSFLTNLACTYLAFLFHAFDEEKGRFRNFMGYDRTWLEEVGSEDSHGRAVWALGEAVALADSDEIRAPAIELFLKALPALLDFSSPRSWASALVGIHSYLQKFPGDREVRRVRDTLAHRLYDLYRQNARPDWYWIEDIVSYGNGKIPQALIVSGYDMGNGDFIQAGLQSLEWLVKIQTDPKGHFVPIGNNGWFTKNGPRARFDQQPIEAQEMIEALKDAYLITADDVWIDYAQMCLEWFLGRNDLKVPLYDYRTGGCCDGLTPTGPNRNQGAESTLAWLLSLLNMYGLRSKQVSIEAERNSNVVAEHGNYLRTDQKEGIP